MTFTYVPPGYLDLVWGRASALLDPAVRRVSGQYTVLDVRAALQAFRMQLWIAVGDGDRIVGAIVTQISDYPSLRALTLLLVGGERIRAWIASAVSALTDWARGAGCARVEAAGRRGWMRVLAPYGETSLQATFRKDL